MSASHDETVQELVLRWEELRERGQDTTAEELCRDRPELVEEVRRGIGVLRAVEDLRAPADPDAPTLLDSRVPVPFADVGLPDVSGYEVLEEVGRGGMGVVYKARQVGLGRLVALKMILAGPHAGPTELARFKAEAAVSARLQHPNIVQVYEVGEAAGRPFMALEFVEGTSLEHALSGRPQPPEVAARLVKQLAEAVQYAHEHGVVHRDLKPANVLLASGGRQSPGDGGTPGGSRPPLAESLPKITDFGLAKVLDAERAFTQTGAVLGTPQYMAPEQAEGRTRDVGPAADVWALGAILYETLTGRPPFQAATLLDTLEQVRTHEPTPPRQLNHAVPRDLEVICLKCLQKDPDHRYASAGALAEDLDRFLQGEPIRARRVRLLEKVTRLIERAPNVSGAGDLRPGAVLGVAPVPLLGHLLLFLLAGGERFYPVASLWMTFLVVFVVMVVVVVGHGGRFPRLSTPLNRQAWSARIGHVLALILVPLVLYLSAPAGRWNPMGVYPVWAVVAGVTFFNLGGTFWGRFYLLGLAVFALAVVMTLRLDWAAVLMGLTLSSLMTFLGLQMRRFVREWQARSASEAGPYSGGGP